MDHVAGLRTYAPGSTDVEAVHVVDYLSAQHRRIRALFTEVLTGTGAARADAFNELRKLLAVHEIAEEQVVHPVSRRALPDGDRIVEERLAEEALAKDVLLGLVDEDPDSRTFERQIRKLEAAVVSHMAAEERDELSLLASTLDADRLARMRQYVELAEAVAPTRPHPGIESATANVIIGPFASILDRLLDLLTDKT